MTSDEEWRPVVGHEDAYEVSSLGRVRTIDRYVPSGWGTRLVRSRMLKVNHTDLYPRVSVAGQPVRVHQLVAEAFMGPRPPRMYVCHNNGNGNDNRASNLRYDTPASNNRDSVAHGTHHFASRTHCKRGHLLDQANTLIQGDGIRRCRTCRRDTTVRAKARYRARRAAS